jgi:hypothetical protein
MDTFPEEWLTPELSRTPELAFRQFDQSRIADEVMWPLVDYYWRDRWREICPVGKTLHIQHRNEWRGNDVDVTLSASKHFTTEEDEEIYGLDVVSLVNLDIETIVADDGRRKMIRDIYQADIEEVLEELDDDELDLEDLEVAIRDDELDDFYFKLHATYGFSTIGGVVIENCRRIEDMHGECLWYDDGDHEEKQPMTDDQSRAVMLGALPVAKIFVNDMEMLESGLYVLNAPDEIHDAFLNIRTNPIKFSESR